LGDGYCRHANGFDRHIRRARCNCCGVGNVRGSRFVLPCLDLPRMIQELLLLAFGVQAEHRRALR
jgi:hypothetical protein